MNLDFSKIKLPSINFRAILDIEPRRLWNGFLWFLVFFALIVIIFDAWVFWYFSSAAAEGGTEINTLKTRKLDKALERLDLKQERLENYRRGPVVEDPS